MRTFIDESGQEWILSLTWEKAEQIAARVERPDSTKKDRRMFDLFNPTDVEQVQVFLDRDPMTGRFNVESGRCLVRILYVLCEEQCKERKMSPEDFGRMLTSGAFADAKEAFMTEFVNFIPCKEQKEMFQNLMLLADGGQSVALSEANQTLMQQVTALHAATTRRVERGMEPLVKMVEQAVAENGSIPSSKSVGRSGLSRKGVPRGKS